VLQYNHFVCVALKCYVLRCSVLQRVAACGSVLQRVAACQTVLQRVEPCYSVLKCNNSVFVALQYTYLAITAMVEDEFLCHRKHSGNNDFCLQGTIIERKPSA